MRVLRSALIGAVLLAIPLSFTAALRGQEPVASLKGRVADTSGTALSGVEVTAQSAALVGAITTRTSETGEYRFIALPPGPYVVAFSRTGLVPVKLVMRLSLAEGAVVSIVMRPVNGDDGAVTVTGERQVFPPSWATSVHSRNSSLDQLPITGTIRSISGLSPDLAAARPDGALFLIDGMPLKHGWRPTPYDSFAGPGRETLQELTVNPGRLAAGYGRLETGAIEAQTVRGANGLSGSFRAIFDGADMNADLLREARSTNGLAGSAEYTLGGSLMRDRAWFFASGRNLRQSVDSRTILVDSPFTTSTRERLGLAKFTFAPRPGHRIEAQWAGANQQATDSAPFPTSVVADAGALSERTLTDRAISASYVGRVNRRLDFSVRYTDERGSTAWAGLSDASRIPLIDQQLNAAWWAPPVCAGCDPRKVTHQTLRLTGDTAIVTGLGTHDITVGYDMVRSSLTPERDPGGDRFEVWATRAAGVNGVVYPVFEAGSTWILMTPGTDRQARVRSDAVFFADRWMPGARISIDLGVRFDRNEGTLVPESRTILSERAISPRIMVNWRPFDAWPWTVSAGFARYTADPFHRVTDDAPGAGVRGFAYQGPPINSGAATVLPGAALNQLFNWFNGAGGPAMSPTLVLDPPSAGDTVSPPRTDEWSFGVSRTLGPSGHVRLDVTRRMFANAVQPDLERTSTGFSAKAEYRFGHYADVDAQYEFSNLSGNTGESMNAGRMIRRSELWYPEYFDSSWRLPVGNLADDARHRLRMWAHSEVMAHDSLGLLLVTLMYSRESGRPYGAAGLVGVAPFVTNPGYAAPPTAVLYNFTEPDAFRTSTLGRTDLGVNYRRRLPGTVHGELLAAFHVLNVMGSTVDWHPDRLMRVQTAFTNPSLQQFNPFVQTPVEGVHWTRDPAVAQQLTTLPRTYRFTLGIRF